MYEGLAASYARRQALRRLVATCREGKAAWVSPAVTESRRRQLAEIFVNALRHRINMRNMRLSPKEDAYFVL